MDQDWISLQSIPAWGASFVFEDQTQWQTPLKEYGINCRILEPLRAEIFISPQDQGVLFRGKIAGQVTLPCDRCADDSRISIKHSFDSFEPYPPDNFTAPGKNAPPKGVENRNSKAGESPAEDTLLDDADEAVIRQAAHGRGIEINPAALIWQEFSLALPIKPLCRENCAGLCPVCGNNNNIQTCSCRNANGDPRLAALRGLTISKK